ncbi:Response regulator CorP [Pseudomonas savastanoi pv. glycinea]|uniref:Response regulator CorP n=2 Tax=Pseudomonas syringae group TaxID=136849 RepID=A0A0P9RFB2_PSESG|nr:response regulator CorP [Pseudomonas savastanoi pv. glycinea str. B076]KPX44537.1 Response regulator CorP [Pseudomonas savastanoi pv. glycinea]RMN24728.1 Response regulator CorP [Pseudomonas cannabina]RMM81477.1 Response regulator CorP [Pseudomonas savastanoi pv. glycinea]RMM85815.1 Response regulator CorP [Pseudomonas savastanoi pv. glycinea]
MTKVLRGYALLEIYVAIPSSSILLTDVHALFRSSMVLMLEMRLPQKTVSEASTLDDVLTQDASLGS